MKHFSRITLSIFIEIMICLGFISFLFVFVQLLNLILA
jgi:hypothetical protein